MHRSKMLCVLVVLMVGGFSSQAAASEGALSVGAEVGYHFELEEPLIGVNARYDFGAAPAVDLGVQGDLNYYFLGSSEFLGATLRSTVVQFDLNVLATANLDLIVAPYIGLGAALLYRSTSLESGDNVISSESSSDLGANLLGGVALELDGIVRPFGQMRMTFLDGETALSLMVGLNVTVR